MSYFPISGWSINTDFLNGEVDQHQKVLEAAISEILSEILEII